LTESRVNSRLPDKFISVLGKKNQPNNVNETRMNRTVGKLLLTLLNLISNWLKLQARNDLKVCFCDAISGIVIVGYLIVFLWRGTFCLLDVALLPENLEVSARFSVVSRTYKIKYVFRTE